MLWYKAWRESRARFLLLLFFMIGDFSQFMAQRRWVGLAPKLHLTAAELIRGWTYDNRTAFFFLLFVPTLLGMGGLLRELGRGTANLSLSIPVNRRRQVIVRAAVGLFQLAVLAVVPAIVIPVLSPFFGVSYPLGPALHFAILWFVCGAVVFAASFLCSAVLSGEYTAFAAGLALILVYEGITVLPWIEPMSLHFNLNIIMSGTKIPVPNTPMLLPVPFPWLTLLLIGVLALSFLVAASYITQRQDF